MEMYLPMRQCRDCSSVDLVVRTTLPPAELAAGVRAALKPIAPNLPGNDFRTLQQLVDKVGLAAALRGAAARRLRVVRADAGVARNLRRDFLFGEPANAGDRHSHGAGRFGIQAASRNYRADAGTRRGGHADRRGGVVGAGAGARRDALRSDGERSADVPPDARVLALVAVVPAIFRRAGPRGSIRRSRCGRTDQETDYSCRRATIGSIRDAFQAGA